MGKNKDMCVSETERFGDQPHRGAGVLAELLQPPQIILLAVLGVRGSRRICPHLGNVRSPVVLSSIVLLPKFSYLLAFSWLCCQLFGVYLLVVVGCSS